MTTEQRDKAAREHVGRLKANELVQVTTDRLRRFATIDFTSGWDAHAATMPDREAVEKVLRANGLSDEPAEFDSSIHSWRCGYPDIYGKCSCFQELAAELLALLDKEGEE